MVEIWGPVITWYTYGESEERASEQCSDGYLVYGVQITLAVCDRRPLSAALLHSGQSCVWIHGTQRASTHSMQLRAVHKTRSWRWTSRTHPWADFAAARTSQTSREREPGSISFWKIGKSLPANIGTNRKSGTCPGYSVLSGPYDPNPA